MTPFGRMFDRFHRQVTPMRIPRYDVFRRSGYDADFAQKAYPNWEEGAEFYDRSYLIDENFYMFQQKAHYLTAKHRFNEAFDAIEEAVQLSKGRNPRINNTHAIVLFEANIGLAAEGQDVRKNIDHSMNILEMAKRNDKVRLAYPAFTYAEQAMRYFDVYGDEKARQKLGLAIDWLKSEVKRPVSRRRAESMISRIESRL